MSEEGKGPRGGDLSQPYQPFADPAWRQKGLNVDLLPGGGIGLHRFEKEHDVAIPGKKNEQPWHRMAAYMLNAGRTNSEIAVAAGVTVGTVSALRAQKWFQELCAIIANTEGEEITGAIRSYLTESIEGIHDIAMHGESERVQLAAWQILLEQGRGKPIQRSVSVVGHSRMSPEDEMAELQQELQALRRTQTTPAPALIAEATVSSTQEKET